MKSPEDWGVSREPDIATLGLIERVRDEWQVRDHSATDDRFDLPQLLRTLAERRRANAGKPRAPFVKPAAERLPAERFDREGRRQPLDAEFFGRTRYFLDDLTAFPDETFIKVAYRCVLKRDADPSGSEAFLSALRKGDLDRVGVLEALRASFEGATLGIAIHGLARALKWRRVERIAHVGPVLGWIHAIANARRLALRIRRLESNGFALDSHLVEVDKDLAGFTSSIATLEEARVQTETAFLGIANRFRRLQVETQAHTSSFESVGREWQRRGEQVEDAARLVASRMDRLEEALRVERVRVDVLTAELADPPRARRSDPINPTESK